jgi:membrane-associated progesterone receptor component
LIIELNRVPGTVFDVSRARAIYGPECSYEVFAGKDISKAVGRSTIKEEEISADYSGLNEAQRKVLDDWYEMYRCIISSLSSYALPAYISCSKKYPRVGKITDMPEAVTNPQSAKPPANSKDTAKSSLFGKKKK